MLGSLCKLLSSGGTPSLTNETSCSANMPDNKPQSIPASNENGSSDQDKKKKRRKRNNNNSSAGNAQDAAAAAKSVAPPPQQQPAQQAPPKAVPQAVAEPKPVSIKEKKNEANKKGKKQSPEPEKVPTGD